MKTLPSVELTDAQKMAAAARDYAATQGWAISVSVADSTGHVVVTERMPGAPLMSAEIAADKATGAVRAGKPTMALEDMINNGRTAGLQLPVLALGGGELVMVDGAVAGAVGISGLTPAQDVEVAKAGVAGL